MDAKHIEGDLWDFGTVVSSEGSDRICLHYVGEDSFDFHELVWEKNIDGSWQRHRTLDPRRFLCSRNDSLWVSELHSFNAVKGTAIIKTGEKQEPDAEGVMYVKYSWVRVSFIEPNKPILLQACESPFDKYNG